MQHQRAQMATDIEAASLLVYNTARLKDRGLPFIKQAAMTKYFTSEVSAYLIYTTILCGQWVILHLFSNCVSLIR